MTQDWRDRWREGRIGFHREDTHPTLVRFWPQLGVKPGAKVLVPLCGKSLDMRWLARHDHPVLGIELAEQAIEQFVAEGRGPCRATSRNHSRSVARAASNSGAATSSTSISSRRRKSVPSTIVPH